MRIVFLFGFILTACGGGGVRRTPLETNNNLNVALIRAERQAAEQAAKQAEASAQRAEVAASSAEAAAAHATFMRSHNTLPPAGKKVEVPSKEYYRDGREQVALAVAQEHMLKCLKEAVGDWIAQRRCRRIYSGKKSR